MIGPTILFIILATAAFFILKRLYRKRGRKVLFWGLGFVAACAGLAIAGMVWCNRIVKRAAEGKCYDQVQACPPTTWGILLGTGRNRRANEYYDSRLASTIKLYRAGRIQGIFVTGENLHDDYQEVDSMYAALLKEGIPSERMVLDTQGVDTNASLRHYRELIGMDSGILISQHFHNERALYYASKSGMDLIAFDAEPHSAWYKRLRDSARERLARVKAVLIQQLNPQKP